MAVATKKNKREDVSTVIVLKHDDYDRLCETITNPPAPTDEALAAARAKAPWE